jgi:hypothetical protein
MRGLIVAAALAFATPALAASYEFPVDVPDGATWTVETVRVRTGERDGKPIRSETRSRYGVRYRSLKGGGGLLTLRLDKGSLPDPLKGVSLAAFERPLELEVDETLTPLRARNWPEYRQALFALLDTDDQAHSIMAPAFNYIGLGQGLALDRGRPLAYEGEQPNPVGGAPIRTRASYVLESVDRKGGRAVIAWKQTLDPESMRAAVLEIARPLLEKAAKPDEKAEVEKLMATLVIGRDDRCRFEIDVPTGLAAKVECSSETRVTVPGQGALNTTDSWTITQTVPERS